MRKWAEKYRKMSAKDLARAEQDLRREIAKIRLEFKVSQPKDTNILSKKRKELAVLLTIKTEKEREVKN